MSGVEYDARSASRVVRPNVLAYVSPTTTRFVVLVGALISAGLFLGTWLHNESPAGADWARRVAACSVGDPATEAADVLTRVPEFRRCTAGVERRRSAFSVAGAVGALVAGVGLMLATPRVIERRRRLRPAGPRLAPAVERFEALAAELHLARAPTLVVGSATMRDAFSYGLPGRYRVVLPPAAAVRWRDSATFDPLVRHELAHVAHHDVAVAWLARSVWIVVVPLLALPVAWGPLSGDLSLLPSYAWRAALLAAVTLIASRALLRSREHDADLRAARTEESAGQLRALLGQIPSTRAGRRPLLAYHPSGEERRGVLDDPARHAAVTFVDCLMAAFLAALILPLFVQLVSIFSGGLSFVVPAALVGPVLGATIGLGLWRQALVRRISGGAGRVAPAALGVLVGYGLGEAASLAQAGGATLGGYERAASAGAGALAVCGATVVAAGLGELFADASGRLRAARIASATCVLLVGALFAVAIWAGTTLSHGFDWAGWTLVSITLVTILSTWLPAGVALGLASASAWVLCAARAHVTAPRWGVEGDEPVSWPVHGRPRMPGTIAVGVSAGAAAALVLVGFRVLAGPAQAFGEQEQRLNMYLWLFATAGAAVALALATMMGTRGLGAALLASPVASIVAAAGFVGLNTALGGSVTLSFLEHAIRPGVALGLVLLLAVAVVALAPRPRGPSPVRILAVAAVASALAGVLSTGVVIGRDVLVPLAAFDQEVAPREPSGSGGTAAAGLSGEALAYTTSYVPHVIRSIEGVEQSVSAIDRASLTGSRRAERVRTECLLPVRALLDDAVNVQPRTVAVQAVHRQLVAVLQEFVLSFEHFAVAYANNDPALFEQARTERTQAQRQWLAWQGAAARLPSAGDSGAFGGVPPAPATPSPPTDATVPSPTAGNKHGRRTCQLFQRMVDRVGELSGSQLRTLLAEMADSVALSGDPDLMRAVADLGQGALGEQPQRFATGMRSLSAQCGVPYR
jgi:hypothetical protein